MGRTDSRFFIVVPDGMTNTSDDAGRDHLGHGIRSRDLRPRSGRPDPRPLGQSADRSASTRRPCHGPHRRGRWCPVGRSTIPAIPRFHQRVDHPGAPAGCQPGPHPGWSSDGRRPLLLSTDSPSRIDESGSGGAHRDHRMQQQRSTRDSAIGRPGHSRSGSEDRLRSDRCGSPFRMLEDRIVTCIHEELSFDNFEIRLLDHTTRKLELVIAKNLTPLKIGEVIHCAEEDNGISGWVAHRQCLHTPRCRLGPLVQGGLDDAATRSPFH